MGLFGVLGYVIIVLELIFVVVFLLGFFVCWVGLIGVLLLLGIIVIVYGVNGFSFVNVGGGWEYLVFWVLVLLVLFCIGDGKWMLVLC